MLNQSTGYPSIDKPWLQYYSEDDLSKEPFRGSMYEYMREATKNTGHKYCLNFFGKRISYQKFYKKIEDTAAALTALGVKRGDVVSICILTIPENYYLLYAANMLGAICNYVAVNTSLGEIRKRVLSTESKYVFTVDLVEKKVVEAVGGETDIKIISIPLSTSMPLPISLLVNAKSKKKTSDRVITWRQFLRKGKGVACKAEPGDCDAPAIIEYTSGTTGESKGVLHPNRTANQMAFNYANLGELLVFDKRDRFLNLLPPFIAYGIFVGTHMAICLGLEVCLCPNPDPQAVVKDFLKYKPNHFAASPAHINALTENKRVQDMNLSFLWTVAFGGDSVSQSWIDTVNDFLKSHGSPNKVISGYGMTEVAGTFCTENHKVDEMIPFPSNNVMILDVESGEEKKIGEEGEVYLSGPTLMNEYYNNEEQTKEAIKVIDGCRWLKTGDLGYVTATGGLVISGRLKRIYYTIMDDGIAYRVYPMKTEQVIDSHEHVKSSAVVGIKDKERGYLSYAMLVLEDGADREKTIKEVRVLCEQHLENSSWPCEYQVVDALPMTTAGKVDYKEIEKVIICQKG